MGQEDDPSITGESTPQTDLEAIEKERLLSVFRDRFNLFLNSNAPRIKLIEISFVPDMKQLIISGGFGDAQAEIPYADLDIAFETIFKRYVSGHPIADSGILRLTDSAEPTQSGWRLGNMLEVTTDNYLMHPLQAGVRNQRYYNPQDRTHRIAEMWIAERFKTPSRR
jgi:hypothetical protein